METPRPDFFQRQNVTAEDLNGLLAYDAAEWREHNRSYHGCGVVCGLAVEWLDFGKAVRVSPGYAIGPQGQEILVPAPQIVAVDCAKPALEDCLEPGQPSQENEVYIAIRYAEDPVCQRPIFPGRCATKDECLPVRMRDGFQIRCLNDKPQHCQPRMDFQGCSAHSLLRGLQMEWGEAALSRLFTCQPDTQEEWLILATIRYERDRRDRLVPILNYGDRTYLPSTQYLLDLLRVLGAQALKRQALRLAIYSIDGISSGALAINRGRIQAGLLVTGRGFLGATAASLEPATGSPIQVQIAAGSVTDETLRIDLRVPVDTPLRRLALVISLDNGLKIHSGDQVEPIFIDLVDNPIEGVPAIRGMEVTLRQIVLNRLQAAGLATAQSLVITGVPELTRILGLFPLPFLPVPLWRAFQIASEVVHSARQWLSDGARP
jgi:hypothetical protein